MRQRGTKSADAETTGVIAVVERPGVPLDLTPEESDVWQGIVEAMPADWFPPESRPLLIQYCRHVVTARRVAQLIDNASSRDDVDIGELKELYGMQAKESGALKTLSASMRLSQQSAYNALSANTAKAKRTVKRLWEG